MWIFVSLLVVLISACSGMGREQKFYRGGVLETPGPLGLNELNSFRFVDKWRISYKWLKGPIEISPCWGRGNPLRHVQGFENESVENGAPIIERKGHLYRLALNLKNELFLYRSNETFYGTSNNRGHENDFQGFVPVCRHVFRDSMDSVDIYLVKPDRAKGTDEWVSGAKPVTVNGLHWLRKTEPIRDWWPSRHTLHRDVAPIDTWVLKIADTPYWLRLVLSSGTGETMPHKVGAYYYPEKHRQVTELFHQMVASVRLEPITPVDIPVDIPLQR